VFIRISLQSKFGRAVGAEDAGLPLSVEAHLVFLQISHVRCIILALVTRVRLEAEMSTGSVLLELSCSTKLESAHLAGEGSNMLMHVKDVTLEVRFMPKFPPTCRTLVLLHFAVYRFLVHLETFLSRILLIADVTEIARAA